MGSVGLAEGDFALPDTNLSLSDTNFALADTNVGLTDTNQASADTKFGIRETNVGITQTYFSLPHTNFAIVKHQFGLAGDLSSLADLQLDRPAHQVAGGKLIVGLGQHLITPAPTNGGQRQTDVGIRKE